MHQPPGFLNTQNPSHVCCLHKALYGLKQAPQAWFTKLSFYLLTFGFQNSRADTSLFFHHTATDLLIILIYVDDILITGSSTTQVFSFIKHLNNTFALHDLGNLNYFLGVEVTSQSDSLHLSQQKYIQDLLHRIDMVDAKLVRTPGALRQQLSLVDGDPLYIEALLEHFNTLPSLVQTLHLL